MSEHCFYIHTSSYLDGNVTIGCRTQIWHFCHIMEHAVIGSDCILGQNVFVGRNAFIGNRVKVQNNVSVFDGVMISDDAFLGPSVVFTNVKYPRSFIDQKEVFAQTYVGRGVTIGANATIVCGVSIGEYSMIGAGSVIVDDVKAFGLIVGNPGRLVGWVSKSGEKLQFDEEGYARSSKEDAIYHLNRGAVSILQ